MAPKDNDYTIPILKAIGPGLTLFFAIFTPTNTLLGIALASFIGIEFTKRVNA
jgi:hypothetical protein